MNFLLTFTNWDHEDVQYLMVFCTGTEEEALDKARELAEQLAVKLPFGWDVKKVEVVG